MSDVEITPHQIRRFILGTLFVTVQPACAACFFSFFRGAQRQESQDAPHRTILRVAPGGLV